MGALPGGLGGSQSLKLDIVPHFAWWPVKLYDTGKWIWLQACYKVNGFETQYRDGYISEHRYKMKRLLGKHGEMWGTL